MNDAEFATPQQLAQHSTWRNWQRIRARERSIKQMDRHKLDVASSFSLPFSIRLLVALTLRLFYCCSSASFVFSLFLSHSESFPFHSVSFPPPALFIHLFRPLPFTNATISFKSISIRIEYNEPIKLTTVIPRTLCWTNPPISNYTRVFPLNPPVFHKIKYKLENPSNSTEFPSFRLGFIFFIEEKSTKHVFTCIHRRR